MEWQAPWQLISENFQNFEEELRKELNEKHGLYGKSVKAKARRIDNDDVLFELSNGVHAVIHLTWSGKKETNAEWPHTTIYSSFEQFVSERLQPDIMEYNAN